MYGQALPLQRATSVLHTATIVLILQRESKISTVRNARKMYTRLKNVTPKTNKTSTARTARKMVTRLKNVILRRSTRNHGRTVTRRVAKKGNAGRKKNMTSKKKRKSQM